VTVNQHGTRPHLGKVVPVVITPHTRMRTLLIYSGIPRHLELPKKTSARNQQDVAAPPAGHRVRPCCPSTVYVSSSLNRKSDSKEVPTEAEYGTGGSW